MKMIELAAVAHGRWPGMLLALGAAPAHLSTLHGPCPFCGGKDRYRFIDDGAGKWFCNKCGHGDGFDWLQRKHGWDLKKAKAEVQAMAGAVDPAPVRQEDPERKADYMRKVWKESKPVVHSDPVWLYLSARCGDPTGYLDNIRHHPALRHSVAGTDHPAMVARMLSPDGKKAVGLHRTYLTQDGRKADVSPVRMSFGEIGTIRLGGAGLALGIAEGVETALCASKRFGRPVWASTCANALEGWDPPDGVSSVLVCGDNDESFTGQAAAYALAKRLHLAGVEVRVEIPSTLGHDWADEHGLTLRRDSVA